MIHEYYMTNTPSIALGERVVMFPSLVFVEVPVLEIGRPRTVSATARLGRP